MSFIEKVYIKKQLKSLGVYKVHAAPPIDIETPREAERKEKERKAVLQKKADKMKEPFFSKLDADFKDFAKKYLYLSKGRNYEEIYTPMTVELSKEFSEIKLMACPSGDLPRTLVDIKIWWKENNVKEPQLFWSAETKLQGERQEGAALNNYGEMEAFLSKALNDRSIVNKKDVKKKGK